MSNNPINEQTVTSIYPYLTQVQSSYSHLLQIRTQLRLFDNNLNAACSEFEKNPNVQNLGLVQNAWNQKFNLMQQIPAIADSIVTNLIAATKVALSTLQANVMSNNKLGVLVSDNSIASICNFVEQNSSQLTLLPYYRQQCVNNGLLLQVNDIEIRARLSRITIPNFERLKKLIRGF